MIRITKATASRRLAAPAAAALGGGLWLMAPAVPAAATSQVTLLFTG